MSIVRCNVLCTLMLVALSTPATGAPESSYHVMHIKGGVFLEKSNKPLNVGDLLAKADQLKFTTNGAVVDVFSSKQGRIVLKPPGTKDNSDSNEVLYLVRDIITSKKVIMSTRGGGINNHVELRNLFSNSNYLLLNDVSVIDISPQAFPMDDNTFFFVRYPLNGKIINRRLGYEGSRLIISFDDIYTLEGKLVNREIRGEFQLLYYDSRKEQKTLIGDVKFYRPDYPKLKEEVGVMVRLLGKPDNRLAQVKSFLADRYGYATNIDINRLLNELR